MLQPWPQCVRMSHATVTKVAACHPVLALENEKLRALRRDIDSDA